MTAELTKAVATGPGLGVCREEGDGELPPLVGQRQLRTGLPHSGRWSPRSPRCPLAMQGAGQSTPLALAVLTLRGAQRLAPLPTDPSPSPCPREVRRTPMSSEPFSSRRA